MIQWTTTKLVDELDTVYPIMCLRSAQTRPSSRSNHHQLWLTIILIDLENIKANPPTKIFKFGSYPVYKYVNGRRAVPF